MRNPLLAATLLLCSSVGVTTASAAAIVYDITFTGNGELPTSGSFTYDSDIPLFTNFVVNWHGISFDLTAEANNPFVKGPPPPACIGSLTGAAAAFVMLSNGCPANETSWNAYQGPGEQFFSFQFDADNDVNGIYVEEAIYGLGPLPQIGVNGDWTLSRNFDAVTDTPEPSTFLPLAMAGLFLLGKRMKR